MHELQTSKGKFRATEIKCLENRTSLGNSENMKVVPFFTLQRQGVLGNRVEMIVERYFAEAATDKHLQILSIKGLVEAASRFVDKDDRDALACVIE